MSAVPQPLPEASRVRSMVDFYTTTMRTAVATQFQYQAANYFYMLGMVAEPVIYLVVWTTIARSNGGAPLDGYGDVVEVDGDRTSLRVPKAETSRVAARLLADHDVLDLTIEDPPIEDVIEAVFAQPK